MVLQAARVCHAKPGKDLTRALSTASVRSAGRFPALPYPPGRRLNLLQEFVACVVLVLSARVLVIVLVLVLVLEKIADARTVSVRPTPFLPASLVWWPVYSDPRIFFRARQWSGQSSGGSVFLRISSSQGGRCGSAVTWRVFTCRRSIVGCGGLRVELPNGVVIHGQCQTASSGTPRLCPCSAAAAELAACRTQSRSP